MIITPMSYLPFPNRSEMVGCRGLLDWLCNRRGQCRICLLEDGVWSLKRPCLCSGSAAFVHPACQATWMLESGRDSCEVCLAPLQAKYSQRSLFHPDVIRLSWLSYAWLWGALLVCCCWIVFALPVVSICLRLGVQIGPGSQDSNTARGICCTAYLLMCILLVALVSFVVVCVWTLRMYRDAFWGRRVLVGVRNRRPAGVAETAV